MAKRDVQKLFEEKFYSLFKDTDYNALLHMTMDKNTKFARLPDFPDLARLRKQHPDLMYQKAVRLLVDRNEIEEKILVPLRRALASMFQLQNVITKGNSLVVDDERPIDEVKDDAIAEMYAQLLVLSHNLMVYDAEPVEASDMDARMSLQ